MYGYIYICNYIYIYIYIYKMYIITDLWGWKIPWRRSWQPTPVLLPGESHGQRSVADYGPWDHKESDMTQTT